MRARAIAGARSRSALGRRCVALGAVRGARPRRRSRGAPRRASRAAPLAAPAPASRRRRLRPARRRRRCSRRRAGHGRRADLRGRGARLGDAQRQAPDRELRPAAERRRRAANRAAIKAAVHDARLLAHAHRAPARQPRLELLADVGGPYILAPVGGTLRSHGKDDRALRLLRAGRPRLRQARHALHRRAAGHAHRLRQRAGRRAAHARARRASPTTGRSTTAARSYEAFSFNAERLSRAGALRVSLLLPLARVAGGEELRRRSRAAELGLVAQRISRRFTLSPSAFPAYIRLVRTLTHALVYVRSGSRTLAGSTRDDARQAARLGARALPRRRLRGRPRSRRRRRAGSVRVHVLVAVH